MSLVKGPFTRAMSVPVSFTVTVKLTLTGGQGSEPNLSAKWTVIIGTMINFHGDFDGHGLREGMCKQIFKVNILFGLHF